MIRTNRDKLVTISVQGEVNHPKATVPYRISVEGQPMVLPGTGGITYSHKIGDNCMDLAGDHVEPGVTATRSDANENGGFNTLACVGNEARVVTGDAKGATGYVTGTHGGAEHVLMYFNAETLDKMVVGDKILVKSCGQGMKLLDAPEVKVMNLDPNLMEKMGITVGADGVLEVPVAVQVPAYLMGSGIGANTAHRGDYDIMTHDKVAYEKFNLGKLRFGDIVALMDCDTLFGRGYLEGAVTIGAVVHSDCVITGHGPGVVTLLTCKSPKIRPSIVDKANIADYLGV
ncbi:MAG: DUF4438 domain-containing protein [Bacillota bacterium]|nr:DUF4438 domain-containing protein [Bacillota bacterium]